MLKYAFANPGKIGDFLYCLPTIKFVCERDNAVADIFSSEICRPTESLIRYQSYVNDFIIPREYKIIHTNQGTQPWVVPVPENKYDETHQLGFQYFPHDGPLHLYIAQQIGVTIVPDPQYEYPDKVFYNEPYVVVGHCGNHTTQNLIQSYKYFIERCPIRTVQVGIAGDEVVPIRSYDQIGIDFLDLASLIAGASAYVGFYSAQLAVANAFPELLKILTSSRSGGENHGLFVPTTISLPQNVTGPTLLKTLMDNLE